MPRATGLDDRFRRAVARADDQIVLIEIELLDGGREQRQAVAIEAAGCPAGVAAADVRGRSRSIAGDTLPGTWNSVSRSAVG